ncbi:GyrI-like domain-containing protein [Fictibacillus aquaticus]|uniref:AraC family transcriptional regulator n=1 Tax=Fictibacillus aquaticus TaxID=2021314 RepID=A0A235FEV7_9BACL|nr:effector binding domain-containing protein [Fictibacillus aquaticus]OYD59484.1 AraC family transcriptional regulator [Fictibacillus aquaticus]
MECTKVKKTFKVVGIKGHGVYDNFGHDVPKLAQKFLVRKDEIENRSDTEIALFEPKRDANHMEGHFYVGLMVNETLNTVPEGMDYIEVAQNYVTVRGEISNIGSLHDYLLKWSEENNHKRDLESHIVETYHPMENGKEEVEIYLPVKV